MSRDTATADARFIFEKTYQGHSADSELSPMEAGIREAIRQGRLYSFAYYIKEQQPERSEEFLATVDTITFPFTGNAGSADKEKTFLRAVFAPAPEQSHFEAAEEEDDQETVDIE